MAMCAGFRSKGYICRLYLHYCKTRKRRGKNTKKEEHENVGTSNFLFILLFIIKYKTQGHNILKKNVLFQVLENMSEISYCSTWSEAQVLLLENSAFKNDVSLLGMDKEDALIGFYLFNLFEIYYSSLFCF